MTPSEQPATPEEIERKASLYILHNLGDRLRAGEPVYDEHSKLWSVSVHSLALPADAELGRIILDAYGAVVEASTRQTLQSAEADYEVELIEKIKSGDQQAEEELFQRYNRGVLMIINRISGNCSAATDLRQETLQITLEKIRSGALRKPEKLSSFIWGVAHRVVYKYFRKLASVEYQGIETIHQTVDPSPNQLDLLLQKEISKIVRRLLDELKQDRDRQVLYRFYIAEESKEEICADMGLTSRQFNLVLFHARKRYRKLYERFLAKTRK